MSTAFYDYIRGLSDTIPEGYQAQGMRLYRHLVMLGVRQQLEAQHPQLPATLGEEEWTQLLETFIRETRWDSHFCGDIHHEFVHFLEKQTD